jgi:hypothetical protein
MIWTGQADALLLKVWKEGGKMTDVAAAMVEAGYDVSRNSIAGRLHRLKKLDATSTDRDTDLCAPKIKPSPKPRAKPMKMIDPTPPKRGPVTAEQIATLEQNEGVDYLENEGCKAVLPKRSGKWKLQMCCGRPFGLDFNGAMSSYCPTHFRLYSSPQAAGRSFSNG